MRFQQAPYRIADVVALLFILHGNTSFGSLAPIIPYRSCKHYLRQYRTILSVESRRQIFWQVKQKAQRILCVFASIFVTVAGKSASEATLKASAVNCAVLPWMKKGFPTPFWRHSPRGLHFAAQRCMALPPPAFSPDASFPSLFMEAFFRLCSPGGFNLLPAPCAHARKTPAAERAAPYLP